MEMTIKTKRLDERAKLPVRSSPSAAGSDLYALLDAPLTVEAGTTEFVRTGLAIEIPEGYAGFVFARSGLASKRGLAPANKVGVIDSDYRGELTVALHNHTGAPVTIEPFERIAQLVIMPVASAVFEETDELSNTERGSGGFGSTGTV